MKCFLKVTELGFMPMYDSDLEEKRKFKVGSEIVAEVKKARNIRFHKKFFGMLRLVYDNLRYSTMEAEHIGCFNDFLLLVKRKSGLAWYSEKAGGYVYASISFDAMDETMFVRFYNLTAHYLCGRYLGCTENDIEDELTRYL